MLRTLGLFILIAFQALPVMASQGESAQVGMILHSQGQVFIQRNGERNAARLADLLQEGDQIITEPGEVTFLFCPARQRTTIKGEASIELGSAAIEVLTGSPPASGQVEGCVLPAVALGAESLERVGALHTRGLYNTPEGEYPALALYLGGPITHARPVFKWERVENAASYQLTLKGEAGEVVWEHSGPSPQVAYPTSAPVLEEGRIYVWEIRARKEPDILESLGSLFRRISGRGPDVMTIAGQSASFNIQSNPELSKTAGDPQAALIRAIELESEGYFSEAADYFRELKRSHPQDMRLGRHLAWLYEHAGLSGAATAEQQPLDSSARE